MEVAPPPRVFPQREAPPAPEPLIMGAVAASALAACGGADSVAALPEAMRATATAVSNPQLLGPVVRSQSVRRSSTARSTVDVDAFLDWAERTYPALFPGHQTSLSATPFVYRYYAASGNYLGVAEEQVYVLGPSTAMKLVRVGALADFAAAMASNWSSAKPETDAQAARFLLQAQFAATDTEVASVRQLGYGGWLQAQFAMPVGMTGFDWLDSRGYGVVDARTYYNSSYPGDYMIWNQLMTGSDALRKRWALALSEFFVVSLSGLDFTWRSHAIAAWWDMLVANAFGNYRTLLQEVTLNAAMGYYLNTKGNQKEDVAKGRAPDENYGREVMQLFSIGLYELNLDGSEKLDAAGQRIETYSQSDITNIARVFTGWDFDQSQNIPTVNPADGRTVSSTTFTRLPMALNASKHSSLEARFLGTTIAASTEGATALGIAMDTLFQHPNVGPFFGKQMIQRLVTSNPSPAYVARVAAAFNDNGSGVRGDLRAVLSAILLDDEARNANGLSDPGFGKLREPMLRLVQWGRTFGIISAQGSWKIGDLSNPATQLAQSPLRSPGVFNYFRPGYVPPSTALSASRTPAPEFQIVNESSVGGYLNYMQRVISSGIYVNAPDLPYSASNSSNGYDITVPYTTELALVLNSSALVERLNLLLCASQLSAATQSLIVNALNANSLTADSSDTSKRNRVASAVFMIMASAEYLIQK